MSERTIEDLLNKTRKLPKGYCMWKDVYLKNMCNPTFNKENFEECSVCRGYDKNCKRYEVID